MHPFHDHLCGQVDDMLEKRGIVVFHDPHAWSQEAHTDGRGMGRMRRKETTHA